MSNRILNGFTLIELMIVIAIIGVLAAIAIPQFSLFVRRSRYTEVIAAAAPYKVGVATCIQMNAIPDTAAGHVQGCGNSGGDSNIPAAIDYGNNGTGRVKQVYVSNSTSSVVVIPYTKDGIDQSDWYVLTPAIINRRIVWEVSSYCMNSQGGGNLC